MISLTLFDRAYGCILGVAIGDAMGMPTSFLTPTQIRRRFGKVHGFRKPFADHPYHAGLRAGEITDDTWQTLAVARAVLARPRSLPETVAHELLSEVRKRGGLDTSDMGPSTRRALTAIEAGVPPNIAGAEGDTNGAAMRISPVPIVLGPRPSLPELVDMVYQVCLPSHGTDLAISGAAAIASAIAACLSGEDRLHEVLLAACNGADAGRRRGVPVIGPSIARRIRLVEELIATPEDREARAAEIYALVGAGLAISEAVPAALGVFALAEGDPVTAILLAVNMGGDCDTVASMAGALSGAYSGAGVFPQEWRDTVEAVNQLGLRDVAARLCDLAEERRSHD